MVSENAPIKEAHIVEGQSDAEDAEKDVLEEIQESKANVDIAQDESKKEGEQSPNPQQFASASAGPKKLVGKADVSPDVGPEVSGSLQKLLHQNELALGMSIISELKPI